MKRLRLLIALSLVSAWLAGPALAQYEEDEQTDDHSRQDQRYLERYQKKETEPAVTPDPTQDRAKAEAEFLAFVDGLIRDRNYRAANSDRYRVQTDDPRVNPKAAAAVLERFRDFFDSFWSRRVEMKPYEKRSRVFLFYSFHKYNQLLGGDFSGSDHPELEDSLTAVTFGTEVAVGYHFGKALVEVRYSFDLSESIEDGVIGRNDAVSYVLGVPVGSF